MKKNSTQPPPADDVADDVARVAELLARVIGQAVLYNEQVARSIGLSAVDLQAFGLISRHDGPMTATKLGAQAGLPPSTVTRVLDRLERAGFIARRADATDRRKLAVEPVAAKAEEVAQHYLGKIDQLRTLHASRTSAEIAVVTAYLSELAGPD